MRKHFYTPFTGRIHNRDMRFTKEEKLAYLKRAIKRAKKAGLFNEQNQPGISGENTEQRNQRPDAT